MTFEMLWSEYCHPANRGDRIRAKMRFDRIIKNGHEPDLLMSLDGYRGYLRRNSWQSPMMLATWLGSAHSERWREWHILPLTAHIEPESDDELLDRARLIQRDRERRGLPVPEMEEVLRVIRGMQQ